MSESRKRRFYGVFSSYETEYECVIDDDGIYIHT